jgi:type II secretory pathway component PulJ
MLEQIHFTGRELLIAVILASVIYLLEVLVFSRRRRPGHSPAMEARMNAMEARVQAMESRLERLEARPPVESALDTHVSNYAEAVRLAREGKTAQALAADLGISRSEADLIVALQRGET